MHAAHGHPCPTLPCRALATVLGFPASRNTRRPGAAAEAERKKEEAFQLQQERLAERRASKERIIASQAGIGRNPSKPSAASRAEPPSSKRARAAPVGSGGRPRVFPLLWRRIEASRV